MGSRRVNITLDDEHAAKLSRLAQRVHVNEGTLARSLLSTAIDDPRNVR
jgi:predicted transcriptional regulator